MGEYGQMLKDLRSTFNSQKTRSYEWRIGQLKAILKLMEENGKAINEALYQDLHKPEQESHVMEIQICLTEVVDFINNLKAWMKPEKVSKSTIYMMDSAYIQREPLGVVLIIGAWNYPIQLVLLPLIGAVAAGNCVVLKPSELSEATAKLFEELIPKYMDGDCVRVVNGGVPETTALLKEKFDHIMYTGNSVVARIVMEAAAKYLTPVLLELGGKSPVYVDKGTNLETVAHRLCWGKFCNAGQTCIAPDYVLCPQDLQDELIDKVKLTIEEFYTKDPKTSGSYARIINGRHFQRVQKLMTGATVACGGDGDEKEKYIAPTVLRDVKLTDTVMQEEIFGPVLPIMPVKDAAEALDIINNREKPLALYVFTNDKTLVQDFRDKTSSGALVINDTMVHGGLGSLPFGGVGNSGMGAYHGKFTYDAFSHSKAVLEKSLSLDQVNNLRYPPYSEKKMSWMKWIMGKKVKKSGALSFLPFMVVGAMFAMFFKTLGVSAASITGYNDARKM